MVRDGVAQGRRRGRGRRALHQGGRTRACSRCMTKMGISTLQSYRGAQIFEAIGLNQRADRPLLHLDRRRASRASASTSIAEECAARHEHAFEVSPTLDGDLDAGRPVPVAPARRVPHVQPRDDRQAAARGAARATTSSSRSTRALVNDDNRNARAPARPACGSSPTRRSRSTRSSRPARSSSGSPPAPCRSARSAARRTRTWPSP